MPSLEPPDQQCYKGTFMKSCGPCGRDNPDDAFFCFQCGAAFHDQPTPPSEIEAHADTVVPVPEAESAEGSPQDQQAEAEPLDERQLWRAFIGPSQAIRFSINKGWALGRADDHYLEKFRHFGPDSTPHFALTWHWPAFLFDPFLWFLYRKMYMYALVYAVGPVASWYVTGDPTVGLIWRIMAGASANYLYYWHVRDHLDRIRKQAGQNPGALAGLLRDEGGVQPYVVWLGIILNVLMFAVVLGLLIAGPPEGMKAPASPSPPAPERKFF